jgi:hypothetical protein
MASGRSFDRSNRVVKYRARCEFWGSDDKYYITDEIFSPKWAKGIIDKCLEWGIIEVVESAEEKAVESSVVLETVEGDIDG